MCSSDLNPTECRRVLAPGGTLIVAVPAADDLIELRTAVGGRPDHRDRVDTLVAEHGADFVMVSRHRLEEHHDLSGEQLRWVLAGTYRGARHSATARLESLDRLQLTLSADICLLGRR